MRILGFLSHWEIKTVACHSDDNHRGGNSCIWSYKRQWLTSVSNEIYDQNCLVIETWSPFQVWEASAFLYSPQWPYCHGYTTISVDLGRQARRTVSRDYKPKVLASYTPKQVFLDPLQLSVNNLWQCSPKDLSFFRLNSLLSPCALRWFWGKVDISNKTPVYKQTTTPDINWG